MDIDKLLEEKTHLEKEKLHLEGEQMKQLQKVRWWSR